MDFSPCFNCLLSKFILCLNLTSIPIYRAFHNLWTFIIYRKNLESQICIFIHTYQQNYPLLHSLFLFFLLNNFLMSKEENSYFEVLKVSLRKFHFLKLILHEQFFVFQAWSFEIRGSSNTIWKVKQLICNY